MIFVLRLGSKATTALNDPTKGNLSKKSVRWKNVGKGEHVSRLRYTYCYWSLLWIQVEFRELLQKMSFKEVTIQPSNPSKAKNGSKIQKRIRYYGIVRTCANDLLYFLPTLAQAFLMLPSKRPPRDPPSGAQAWTRIPRLLFSAIESPGW